MTTMTEFATGPAEPGRGRRLMLLIFMAFLGPLLLAVLLYAQRDHLHLGHVNYGRLIVQPVASDGLRQLAPGHWRYLRLAGNTCNLQCEADLFKLNQLHMALGKERDRVVWRVLLPSPADAQWDRLRARYPRLRLEVDPELYRALNALPGVEDGHTVLVDPLGNAVLDYAPGFNVRPVTKDILRLLKVSKIG